MTCCVTLSAVKTFHAETGMSKKVPKLKQLPVSMIYFHYFYNLVSN